LGQKRTSRHCRAATAADIAALLHLQAAFGGDRPGRHEMTATDWRSGLGDGPQPTRPNNRVPFFLAAFALRCESFMADLAGREAIINNEQKWREMGNILSSRGLVMSYAKSQRACLMALAGFVGVCLLMTPTLSRAAEANSSANKLVVDKRVLAQAGSTGGSIGKHDKSLSGDSPPPSSMPSSQPRLARRSPRGGESLDGAWTVVVGQGCGAGTMPFSVSHGQINGQGLSGRVSSTGLVSSVYHGSGITSLSNGRLSGRSGSGTFKNSDGCTGRWTAIKQ
jgi:hypothetical protein